MPHIHTQPGQHDLTVSAYIIRQGDGEWQCLVHMHKKIGKLMQVGGHIELDETPWQSLAHELRDEAGYTLSELSVLQPVASVPSIADAVIHPVPFVQNTHDVGSQHYHSDMCFGFLADSLPAASVAEGESEDIRWLTLTDMAALIECKTLLEDTADIYAYLIQNMSSYQD
jgi:8-oxo-dGTP pyrophosphatase MutT (NUDIX family)